MEYLTFVLLHPKAFASLATLKSNMYSQSVDVPTLYASGTSFVDLDINEDA